jgi:hypothetical protein
VCFDRSVSPGMEEPGRNFFEEIVGQSRAEDPVLSLVFAVAVHMLAAAPAREDVAGEGALETLELETLEFL